MRDNQVKLPDGSITTPYESSIQKESIEKLQSYINSPEGKNIMASKIQKSIIESLKVDIPQDLSQEDKLKFLTDRIDSMKSELITQTDALQSIHYENMKLNAQIEVLNKTIDSKDEELSKLQDINTELKTTNQTLEESNNSNRGYWIKTILIGIFTTVLGFLLGKYV